MREDIENSLQSELSANRGAGWDFKLRGRSFTPNPQRPYVCGTTILGQPSPVAYGTGAYHRTYGFFQIDLYYPIALQETEGLLLKADALALVYYPANNQGRLLEGAGGVDIHFHRKPATGIIDEEDDSFIKLNLDVHFYVDSPPA